jgi:hypothetical protein
MQQLCFRTSAAIAPGGFATGSSAIVRSSMPWNAPATHAELETIAERLERRLDQR